MTATITDPAVRTPDPDSFRTQQARWCIQMGITPGFLKALGDPRFTEVAEAIEAQK